MGYKSPSAYAGQINLKGKKEKRLACGCCTMYNFHDKQDAELAKKEMKDFDYDQEND